MPRTTKELNCIMTATFLIQALKDIHSHGIDPLLAPRASTTPPWSATGLLHAGCCFLCKRLRDSSLIYSSCAITADAASAACVALVGSRAAPCARPGLPPPLPPHGSSAALTQSFAESVPSSALGT